MSDSITELKRALECLRLASDLMQFSRETLSPELKAHCVRMAGVWTHQAEFGPVNETAPHTCLRH